MDTALQEHLRLVAGLRRTLEQATPGAPVQVLQTHLSSVLLAGDTAWKLKKPVATGFADFSTLERRHFFCEEELRVNRRTAPTLYLGTAAVLGPPEAPRFGAPRAGEPVLDWAVRMRRFDAGALLAEQAAQGRLAPPLIDRLAQRIAAFHAGLPPSPPGFGAPAGVRRWTEDNLRELTDTLPGAAGPVAALARWSADEFARLEPLLARRVREGRVREGHGDLHLANIALIDGEPLPFDAIEFNAELRHIDVMSDAAFVFMDLMAHGLPRLAWRFVNGWSEATGDRAGLALLRFFAVYRALVRAKVAALRAAQPDAGSAEAAAQRSLAARGLALAGTLVQHRPPLLVLSCGLSGSGKSTVAQTLLETLGALRLRSDVERKRLFGMAPTERPAAGSTLYGADATRRTYARLKDLARELLAGGSRVVVDAAFLRRDERAAMRMLAAEAGARFAVVECRAPEALLRQRLRAREAAGSDPSDAGEAVLALQQRVAEPPGADEQAGLVTLDTGLDAAALDARCVALAAALESAPDTPAALRS